MSPRAWRILSLALALLAAALLGALVAGVVAVGAAISVTPVGQQWVDELSPAISSTTTDLIDDARGLLP